MKGMHNVEYDHYEEKNKGGKGRRKNPNEGQKGSNFNRWLNVLLLL